VPAQVRPSVSARGHTAVLRLGQTTWPGRRKGRSSAGLSGTGLAFAGARRL